MLFPWPVVVGQILLGPLPPILLWIATHVSACVTSILNRLLLSRVHTHSLPDACCLVAFLTISARCS